MPQLLNITSCPIYSTVDISNLLENKRYKKRDTEGGERKEI